MGLPGCNIKRLCRHPSALRAGSFCSKINIDVTLHENEVAGAERTCGPISAQGSSHLLFRNHS